MAEQPEPGDVGDRVRSERAQRFRGVGVSVRIHSIARSSGCVPVSRFSAGFVFLLANMAYATTKGKPSVAPFMDISTIFHGRTNPPR